MARLPNRCVLNLAVVISRAVKRRMELQVHQAPQDPLDSPEALDNHHILPGAPHLALQVHPDPQEAMEIPEGPVNQEVPDR